MKSVHFPYGDVFHRVEVLQKTSEGEEFFTRAALSDEEIGGQLHCGHGGLPCPYHNIHNSGSVRILDSNGIFTYRVFQCLCLSQESGQPTPVAHQFFQMALFPATYERVQTAITFKALRLAQLHNFGGKESVWDFYEVVQRWTNNVNPLAVPVCSTISCS